MHILKTLYIKTWLNLEKYVYEYVKTDSILALYVIKTWHVNKIKFLQIRNKKLWVANGGKLTVMFKKLL